MMATSSPAKEEEVVEEGDEEEKKRTRASSSPQPRAERGPFSSRNSSALLKRSPRVLVPWKSSANNSATTPLSVQTPSAHLRSISIMNFAVLSSAVAQRLCCA